MSVLVTGGAGFIGSHTAVVLHESGRNVVILDDLSNSSTAAVDAIRSLTRPDLPFVEADAADRDAVGRAIVEHGVDEVIHFAAFKSVAESVEKPLAYYSNNVGSTIGVVEAMIEHGVTARVLVFMHRLRRTRRGAGNRGVTNQGSQPLRGHQAGL